MSVYAKSVYGFMLNNILFSVDPTALSPAGGAVPVPATLVRPTFGDRQNIPEQVFIINNATEANGFEAGELADFNGFVQDAVTYHELFGLPPQRIDSLYELLEFYDGNNAIIDGIRIVTHGWLRFMQMPMFSGGDWNEGITEGLLEALADSDESGVRWYISNDKDKTPTLYDSANAIVDGIRVISDILLDPWDIRTSGNPPLGNAERWFNVIADQYNIKWGTFVVNDPPGTNILISSPRRTIVEAGLDFIEAKAEADLIGDIFGGKPPIDAAALSSLRSVIMAATPAELGFMGGTTNLNPTLEVDIPAAVTEQDIRDAIVGSITRPMFVDKTREFLTAMITINSSDLDLSGTLTITNWTDISGASLELLDFFRLLTDLMVLNHGSFKVDGNIMTPGQKVAVKAGLLRISDMIRPGVITSRPDITDDKLTTLWTKTDALIIQEILPTNDTIMSFDYLSRFRELDSALPYLNGDFRRLLDHFKTIALSVSHVDIRGCKVGGYTSFLDKMRTFLGATLTKPVVSAPDWWQSFPTVIQAPFQFQPEIFDPIDDFVRDGIPPNIDTDDINLAVTEWSDLIGFTDQYEFFKDLFGDTNTHRWDFVSLEWLTWRASGGTTGIPVMGLEAERIDDLLTLNLSDIIERFEHIFEIVDGTDPSDDTRTMLTSLLSEVPVFRTLKDSIAAAIAPNATELSQYFTLLTNAVNTFLAIPDIPVPAVLLIPAVEPAGLTKANIDSYVITIQGHLDSTLETSLRSFFTSIRTRNGEANNEIRHYMNIGLPLPIQSGSHPTEVQIVPMISMKGIASPWASMNKIMQSFMRVEWTGSDARLAVINAAINARNATNATQLGDMMQLSRLSKNDPTLPPTNPPTVPPTNPAAFCPMDHIDSDRDYSDHIIERP